MALGTDSPVSVNNNEIAVPLGALPFLSYDLVEHVKKIDFSGEEDDGSTKMYHRIVAAIDIVSSTSLTVTTTVGDVLVWPSAEGDEGQITVTLADGTSWTKGAACSKCVATNVLATEEDEQGIQAFLVRIGFECPGGRHLTGALHFLGWVLCGFC